MTGASPMRGEGVNHSLPVYKDLPIVDGGARSAWHVFGEDDQVGLLNLQTAQTTIAASRLVISGEVFSLNASLHAIDPPMFGRSVTQHHILDEGTGCDFDDSFDSFNPQASSQWDSLAHAGYAPNEFYNGATAADIRTGKRNTIEHWARRGIVGRAILLDMDAVFGGAGVGFDPSETHRITVDELEAARVAAGIEWEPGDIMLLHTGYLAWYVAQPEDVRIRQAEPDTSVLASVGLEQGASMLAYLWDSRISAVASDNPAVEAMPFDVSPAAWPYGFLHQCLIGQLGMALGELWWLHDLALACRGDSRYASMLTAAPLHSVGGISSPPNALAIR